MKINLRQEIAMWVLGLIWTGVGFVMLVQSGSNVNGSDVGALLILLVPVFLIIFSLRTRHKPESTKKDE